MVDSRAAQATLRRVINRLSYNNGISSMRHTEAECFGRVYARCVDEDAIVARRARTPETAGAVSRGFPSATGPGHLSNLPAASVRTREKVSANPGDYDVMAVQSDVKQSVHSLHNGGHAQLASLLDSIANMSAPTSCSARNSQQSSAALMV